MASSNNPVNKLAFMRITVIGASESGKTSLINSFVNGVHPTRYVRTDKCVVYHKKVEIQDEGEYGDVRKPIFVEIEDSPGSERGAGQDDEEGPAQTTSGPPRIRKGSNVTVIKDRAELVAIFNKPEYKRKIIYKAGMDGMLGKDYVVKTAVEKDGIYGLPSLDGSDGGVWNFPKQAISLKVSLDTPIDAFLNLGIKPPEVPKALAERRKYEKDLQTPLLAYKRKVDNPDEDKTLTKNRMGYFICFDISDESFDSLREAMELHRMLKKSLEKQRSKGIVLKPVIYLIGCKADRTSSWDTISTNRDSARAFSDREEILFRSTSAREHKGVVDVFNEMLQAISGRETLWSMEGVDEQEDAEADGGCFTQ